MNSANGVTQPVAPISERTSTSNTIFLIDNQIAHHRERADRLGVEGEYNEDVDIMHSLINLRASLEARADAPKVPSATEPYLASSSDVWMVVIAIVSFIAGIAVKTVL